MTITHPAWCLPAACTARDDDNPYLRGEHRSADIQLDLLRVLTNAGPVPPTSAFLSKAHCPWDTETFLRLISGAEDVAVPAGTALTALTGLTSLVVQAAS